ncbi:hypothetical protein ACFLR1_01500 [Bacteroidota bacterium]
MKAIYTILISGLFIFTCQPATAEKIIKDTDRGYAFDGRNFVVSIGSGFFGYSYGFGKLGGAPLMISAEYGIHRYVGAGIYGGLLDRNPHIGETKYDMTIYTVGVKAQFHMYNLLDDIVKKNLRGDIIDVYGIFYLGMDHYATNMSLRNKQTYYISGGIGIRAYPFKKAPGLGVYSEFSPVLTPWQLGLNYRF